MTNITCPPHIYLDLDGVMADFDFHFPNEFGLDHKAMPDGDMWEKINQHQTYFEDMPLCDGAIKFFETIRHLNPKILTACPKTNYTNAAKQKRNWVRKHLGEDITVLPVLGGTTKYLFMHKMGDILIDDYAANCIPWINAGGIAIHHVNFERTHGTLSRRLSGWNIQIKDML